MSFDLFVKPLLARLPPEEKLVAMLGIASVLTGHKLGTLVTPFKDDFDALLVELDAACEMQLRKPVTQESRHALTTLIANRDFVGVAVHLMVEMQDRDEVKNLRAGLIDAVRRHVIEGHGPQSNRHLAMALLLGEHYDYALEQAKHVAEANPDNLVFQTTVLCVLYNTPGADAAALREIVRLRAQYKLDEETEKSVTEVEAMIRARKAGVSSD